MPRLIHPALPRYDFHTDVQIYISHVNQGGHLDNAQLLTLVSEARLRFFNWLGYQEFNEQGYSFVVGDMVAQYKSEGFHGEVMRLEMAPADFNPYGFDLLFRMTETRSGRDEAIGKSGIVFLKQPERKVTPVPQALLERLRAL